MCSGNSGAFLSYKLLNRGLWIQLKRIVPQLPKAQKRFFLLISIMHVLLCFSQMLLIQKLFFGGGWTIWWCSQCEEWQVLSCVCHCHVRLCDLSNLPSGCTNWSGDIWLTCHSVNEGFVIEVWFLILSCCNHVSALCLNHLPYVLTTSPKLVTGERCGFCHGPGEWKCGPKNMFSDCCHEKNIWV